DTCRHYFGAEVQDGLDFTSPSAVDRMNDWASNHTHGKIDKIVTQEEIAALLWAVMNAVYFKGDWTTKFDPSDTYSGDFYLDSIETKSCDMMKNERTYGYLETDLFQAVDLPYGEEAFSMTVLLPQPDKSVDDVAVALTTDDWALWLDAMTETLLELHLPAFRYECEYRLKNALTAMGMEKSFNRLQADFSDMMAALTFIKMVKQKTFVQVDEDGTEAAAVTIVGGLGATPPAVVKIDRPFLFIIHEHVSKTILFIGRVCEPVWEE
ncbi:MAG: serpin family protein, partial [Planctomycetes bacterium]|nr:serpin family protein [Planctomycetota bacterium]